MSILLFPAKIVGGGLCASLLSYLIPVWSSLQLVAFGLGLAFFIPVTFFAHESPRWLLSKGKERVIIYEWWRYWRWFFLFCVKFLGRLQKYVWQFCRNDVVIMILLMILYIKWPKVGGFKIKSRLGIFETNLLHFKTNFLTCEHQKQYIKYITYKIIQIFLILH